LLHVSALLSSLLRRADTEISSKHTAINVHMFWLNAFINTTCKILQFVYHNISTITVTNFIAVHFTKKN